MASKNEARRHKKKAERARNRKIISKSKIDVLRTQRDSSKQYQDEFTELRSNIMLALDRCNGGLYHMDRLFGFTEIMSERSKSFHTEELTSKFENYGLAYTQEFSNLQDIKTGLEEYIELLRNPLGDIAKLLSVSEFLMSALPVVDSFKNSVGRYATGLLELIDESNKLYTDLPTPEEGTTPVTPVATDAERSLIAKYAEFDLVVDPVAALLASRVGDDDTSDTGDDEDLIEDPSEVLEAYQQALVDGHVRGRGEASVIAHMDDFGYINTDGTPATEPETVEFAASAIGKLSTTSTI